MTNPTIPDAPPLCACGCGLPAGKGTVWALGHRAGLSPPLGPPPLCACGCGQPTNRMQRKRRYSKYLRNHHLKALNQITGPSHHAWQGGEVVRNGYVYLRAPHRRAVRGYVKRCYLVIEEALGRALAKGEEVHHINGQKDDDRPENLEVMTKSEHMRHHLQQRPVLRGERASSAKLTEADVVAIRRRYASGERRADLAREFGVTHTNVTDIVNGKTWTHLPTSPTQTFDRASTPVSSAGDS
jgi:hypothetical protein